MSTSGSTTFTDGELRQIAVRVAESLRNHPEIEGGVSVRATISFLEVLEAMSIIEGNVSIQALYDAAFSTFGGRIRTRGWRKAEDILQEILDEIFFGNKPDVMKFSPQSFDEELIRNLRNLMQDLMTLSVAHKYGPPVKEEAKTGVYPRDLSRFLRDGNEGNAENHSSLPALKEALRNAMDQSMRNGASSPFAATRGFLENLEKFNLMKRDLVPGTGGRYKFTKGAVNLVGEKTAKDILRDHYEELVDNDSGEVGESVSREELANLLNELQILLDLMQTYRLGASIETLMHLYGNQFPTLSKILGKMTPMVTSHSENLWKKSSRMSEAFIAILETLIKEKYMEYKEEYLPVLSTRGYELVFEDVLPEVERTLVKGEHDALAGSGNEGEVIDIRRYRQGDRFRDIAIRATFKEMVKHRRRQPETRDLRANQFLPRRSLDIALAIDSSRSMAQHGKLLYAKKAAVGLALAAARRGDRVGVLAFSDFAKSLIDPTGNVNQRFLEHVTKLRPLNSTNVEDALKKAAKALHRQQMDSQKHIILITDGVPTSCTGLFNTYTSPPYAYYYGTYFRDISMKAAYAQAKSCLAQGVTISTICIDRGEHVNREFCQTLSRLGKGRAYFLKDERKLLQTALKEYLTYQNSFIG